MPSTGTLLAPEASAHQAHLGAVVVGDDGDVGRLHFLIAGIGHLERRGQVGPQLEPVHAPGLIALGHLLMDDSLAGGHPLDVARGDRALVAHAVGVVHRSGQDIRDGFDPAVRMPGESRQIIGGNVVAEVVEQQERIEIGGVAEPERAAQVYAGSFERRLGLDQTFHGSDRHERDSCMKFSVPVKPRSSE